MKCFFDGSGATDPDGHAWLTLAGFMAADAFWKQFEKDWVSEVLAKRDPYAPYLHMSELLSGNRPFDRWPQDRRYNLVWDAVYYLQDLPKKAFCAVVCSMDETAHTKLVCDGWDIPEPHDTCSHCCIGKSFSWYYDANPQGIETAYVYFDQNERFMHPFRQRWQKENKGQRLVIKNAFWGLIADVGELDMRNSPALQASDLLAWAASRRYSAVQRPFLYLAEILQTVIPHWVLTLDAAVLREKYSPERKPDAEDTWPDQSP